MVEPVLLEKQNPLHLAGLVWFSGGGAGQEEPGSSTVQWLF